jgi:hypothetical protein
MQLREMVAKITIYSDLDWNIYTDREQENDDDNKLLSIHGRQGGCVHSSRGGVCRRYSTEFQ